MRAALSALRRRYGLHWRGTLPAMPWRELGAVLFILLAYDVVDRIDAQAEQIAKSEARAREAAINEQRLLDCMNGRPLGYVERKPTRGPNDGGRTYTLCKIEEIEA
jgi:hypothetical protein